MGSVALEIRPEPAEQVREALERALERELAEDTAPSAWWLAGVRESVGGDEED